MPDQDIREEDIPGEGPCALRFLAKVPIR